MPHIPQNIGLPRTYMDINAAMDEATEGVLARFNQLKHTLSDKEIEDVASKVFQFCMEATGVELYPYQQEFGLRMVLSILREDADEITALFSRQSGKTETVAVVVAGCTVLLPRLANLPGPLAEDGRIAKFKHGFWVGIFAPIYEQGSIMHGRVAARLHSPTMRAAMADPEIALEPPKGRASLALANGSYVDVHSAAPGTNIEGQTYHLLILEECQDIGDYKIKKSIHPMGAATGASIIKIGTPSTNKADFYEACERNRANDFEEEPRHRNHYQFDYTICQMYNPRYRKFVTKEIERLGYDSDEFRMAYRLHWMLERGMFLTAALMDEAAVNTRDKLRAKVKGIITTFSRPDYPTTHDKTTQGLVAALDIGRDNDSTVLTVAKVWWDNPFYVAEGDPRYPIHIMNWLELEGDDHEAQYPKILDFLSNYNISVLIVDSTGRGDPVRSRLETDLDELGVHVIAFVTTLQSKHKGYKMLYREIREGRFTFPAGKGARKQRKWREFWRQMTNAVKIWKGKFMTVEAPTQKVKGRTKKKVKDDYVDCAMMLCHSVNAKQHEIDQEENEMFKRFDPHYKSGKARSILGGRTPKSRRSGRGGPGGAGPWG